MVFGSSRQLQLFISTKKHKLYHEIVDSPSERTFKNRIIHRDIQEPALPPHKPTQALRSAADRPAAMPGFDFSNHNRNVALHAKGVPLPKATSTGTTIVGCVFDGGVVIAADTRATSGPIVADKVFYHPFT